MRVSAAVGGFFLGAGVGLASAACPASGEQAVVLRRPADGVLLAGFGIRVHPLLNVTKMHTGIDFHGAVGDPIRASAPGEVVEAAYKGQSGNFVRIRHGDGIETTYAHLVRFLVKEGDCVEARARIGDIGNTGLTTGPHLHFEVLRNGEAIDPLLVLGKDLP